MASAAIPADFVDAIASEVAVGVERAVEFWMSQIDDVLTDMHLTSLGRLNAVRAIVTEYKCVTGKAQLQGRDIC